VGVTGDGHVAAPLFAPDLEPRQPTRGSTRVDASKRSQSADIWDEDDDDDTDS